MKKKTSILIYPLLAIGFLLILTNGCKKDDPNSPIETGTVTDIDGNVYQTVKIGAQTWMAENLKVTKYCNGDSIPNVTNGTEWLNLKTGAYCDYENTASNSTVYGKLYNWFAVSDSRKIAPTGWHVASDAEWTTLTTFLDSEVGGKLKEKGTVHWLNPNEGATNETGFTALPAGCRGSVGYFYYLGSNAYFWSSTEYNGYNGWCWDLIIDNSAVYRNNYNKSSGVSVRCLKD